MFWDISSSQVVINPQEASCLSRHCLIRPLGYCMLIAVLQKGEDDQMTTRISSVRVK